MRDPRPIILLDALAARFGGAAHGTPRLVEHLVHNVSHMRLMVVTRSGSIVARELSDLAGVETIELSARPRAELAGRLLWEATVLPRLAEDHRSAVLTWSGMMPRAPRARVVSYLANPLVFKPGRGNLLRRAAVRHTGARAAAVVVPSEAMGRMVAQKIGLDADVVPLGLDHDRFTPGACRGTTLLAVADFYAHKRHDILIRAWAALPQPRPLLRLVGDARVDPPAFRRFLALRDELGAEDVEILSALTRNELVDAYRSARLFVLPSEAESFCMPLCEAQACGVPVLARDIPALRETGGDGAHYLDSDDPTVWTEAIRAALENRESLDRLRAAGIRNARRFTWERTAEGLAAHLLGGEVI